MAAAAGFRVRKVKFDRSIGDRLKRARVRRKISIAEAEEVTKIRAKFITALESDSWDLIPSEVYGRGYLESYVDFLKLPQEEIMTQYDRERGLYAASCKECKVDFAPKSELHLPRFLITPRSLLITGITLGVLLFGGVIFTQLRKFSAAPYLELIQPVEAAEINGTELTVHTDKINLNGKTAIGARVLVNGQPATVTDGGHFQEMVNVQKGLNSIIVEATSSNGKKTTEILTVTVK